MKIIYVHGLGSGAKGGTGQLIRQAFSHCQVVLAEMPIKPLQALDYLSELVRLQKPNLIIGTSLGAFYAMQIAGPKKLLINPALDADNDVRDKIGLGTFQYFCERQDLAKEYVIDEQMIADLKLLKDRFYGDWLDWEVKSETFAVFVDADELFSHKDTFARYFRKENMLSVAGLGHRLDRQALDALTPYIQEILDKKNLYNL